ncbi:MAG: cyclohydrolase [Myxococcaceae bacterium]|nr:cyclohydrolase [Myxococcaceae bacterium]
MADTIDEAAQALRAFLLALGLPVDADPELSGTPERAARAWRDEFLDGYRHTAAAVLAEALPSSERSMVVLADVTFATMCPHHLLPSVGRATVGYLPGGRIVGLGALVQLVECFAHRLVLQETLGRQVADALVEHLGARAAGVVLEGRHACLSQRGERQAAALVVTQSFAGRWADDVAARREFLDAAARRGA